MVFVLNVQIVQRAQEIVPTSKWLKLPYGSLIFRRGSMEVTALDHFLKVLCRVGEWEVHVFCVSAISRHDLDGQEIQCGTQVVNRVADNHTKIPRRAADNDLQAVLTIGCPSEVTAIPIRFKVLARRLF